MKDRNKNDALADALHEIGEPATPEELSASGVRRVRRVSREMVSRLIEKAVNRTLMERTIGVPHGELQELIRRAHDEFNRIVGHRDEIERTRERIGEQRVALKEELTRIRAEIDERARTQAQSRLRPRVEVEQEENDFLAAAIRAAFAKLDALPPELRRLERAVIIRTLESLETARESAIEAGRSDASAQIEELERRIAKLMSSLQASEQALARASRLGRAVDGLESIYRTVQGLDPGDPGALAKVELMRALFEKNLELYRSRNGAPRPAAG